VDRTEEIRADPPSPPKRGGRIPLPRLRRAESPTLPRLAPVLKKVKTYNPKADLRDLEQAYLVAEAAHEGQKRLSGEDYIEHPVAVAGILADLHLDTTTLEAALLHDTVEDTPVTIERIEEEFGEEVGRIVDGLKKLD